MPTVYNLYLISDAKTGQAITRGEEQGRNSVIFKHVDVKVLSSIKKK